MELYVAELTDEQLYTGFGSQVLDGSDPIFALLSRVDHKKELLRLLLEFSFFRVLSALDLEKDLLLLWHSDNEALVQALV